MPTAPSLRAKHIHFSVGDDAARQLLRALVEEWGWSVRQAPSGEIFSLVEGENLSLPVTVDELWSLLEGHLMGPGQKHQRSRLRLPLQAPVTVLTDGTETETRLTNLSELGARFLFDQELTKGEELSLRFEFQERGWQLTGKVVYVLPHRGGEVKSEVEVGAIFVKTEADKRQSLHDLILLDYLQRAQRSLSRELFGRGLGFLAISGEVRGRLLARGQDAGLQKGGPTGV